MRLFPHLVLSSLLFLLIPSASSSLTIAGFGDSLTCDTCNDGSYLRLLEDILPIDPLVIEDYGIGSQTTSQILGRFQTWVATETADLLILLSGTVNTYLGVGGYRNTAYSQGLAIGDISSMVNLAQGAGIPTLLVGPTAVVNPCDGPLGFSCATVNARLERLSYEGMDLAARNGIPFVDAYSLFARDPRYANTPGSIDSLYFDDGLHMQLGTGDALLASAIAPVAYQLLMGDNGSETAPIPNPEPHSAALFAMNALIGAAGLRRRSRKRQALA